MATQETDTTTQQILNIANTGEADLIWDIVEENTTRGGGAGSEPERRSGPGGRSGRPGRGPEP